jgi:hypothetical protein
MAMPAFGAAAPAVAQGLQWQVARVLTGRQTMMAFDIARGRTVLFGGRDGSGTLFGDTWEFDGLTWDRRSAAGGPSPRWVHAMAYDAQRRRVVLFGGASNVVQYDDTWTWDGDRWTLHSPTNRPPASSGHSMCYDSARGRIVMHQLANSVPGTPQTWEWDGSNWQQTTIGGPPRMEGQSMAYDPLRQRAVVYSPTVLGQPGQTWEYDGASWSLRSNVGSPTSLSGVALAFDPGLGRIVMFGGSGFFGPIGGTLEYDGNSWQAPAGSGPAPRYGASLVHDTRLSGLVMFGGVADGATWVRQGAVWTQAVPAPFETVGGYVMAADEARADVVLRSELLGVDATWLWNGSQWRQQVGTSPSAISGAAMTWDGNRQAVLWFGGRAGPGLAPQNATWIWNGAWTQLAPAASPPARHGHAMAFDRQRQRVVLFGGSTNSLLGPSSVLSDTWEWDGFTWVQRTPGIRPSARWQHGMAYDPILQRTVLCGGTALGLVIQPDTWEWDGQAWVLRSATSVPGFLTQPPMTFDPALQGVVIAGNASGTFAPVGVWQWSGGAWQQLPTSTANAPAELAGSDWCVDPGRGRLLTYGAGATLLFGALVPPAVQVVGAPCPNPQLPLLTSNESYLGNARFALELIGSPGGLSALAWSLGSQSTPIGPCTFQLAAPWVAEVVVADGFGISRGTPWPQAPVSTWRGLPIFAQAVTLDPTGPLGLGFSALRQFVLGD